ncbi:MAG TPA: DUF2892 domain-containing protein [Thiotrichales bacterium]|nr:DUF2892 domain-containing protein [Thiotrichales bacterium]
MRKPEIAFSASGVGKGRDGLFQHRCCFIGLAIFVGINLAQSGLTNFCPLASMLKRAGVPEGSNCS